MASCVVCFGDFSADDAPLVPRILPCGHTLCTACAEQLIHSNRIDCPNRCPTAAVEGGAESLPRNFALLSQASEGTRGAPGAVSQWQHEKERLRTAKEAAVAVEDYALAMQLKAELDAVEAQGPTIQQVADLEEQKVAAVAREDYALASRLKQQIDKLLAGDDSGTGEAHCYDLGSNLGALLRLSPRASDVPSPTARSGGLPTPVVVLDRSPSMGGTARWAVTVAVPAALRRLGYGEDVRCVLLTFDSVSERVQMDRRDPTLAQLGGIDLTCRGRTTLLAPVVDQLARVLRSSSTASNIFVISDGHVFDLPLVKTRADRVVAAGGFSARVCFSLFRFFNGEPPDTAALAAVASIGTDGPAPCVDCMPPAQWTCPVCTVMNPYNFPQCELCQANRPPGEGGDNGGEALTSFVETAVAAFTKAVEDHTLVDLGEAHRRLPCGALVEGPLSLPRSTETFLLLPRAVKEVRVDGRRVAVSQATGVPSTEDLDAFSEACLSQLRLWLVGGTRSNDFREAITWFLRLLDLRDNSSEVMNTAATARAWALRTRVQEGESALGRLCGLADADSFVGDLNSKQQGDFLRGGSVSRAQRLVARRALGSDIIYHDAVRAALSATPAAHSRDAVGEGEGSEQRYVSCYGGSTYSDTPTVASILAPCAEDLSVSQVLSVLGGLGVPFVAGPVQGGGGLDNIWLLEVLSADPTLFLSEADVWASRSNGDTLTCEGEQVTGVVPLTLCGPAAHDVYYGTLAPVPLMHVGSQLRGATPARPWGWDPARPPYTLPEAATAREAAVLRCLLASVLEGGRSAQQTAEIAAGLFLQISARAPALSGVPAIEEAHAVLRTGEGSSTVVPLYAAAVLSSSSGPLPGLVPRVLYEADTCLAAGRAGAGRRDTPVRTAAAVNALIDLLADAPSQQRIPLSEDQVLARLNDDDDEQEQPSAAVPDVDARMASMEVIAERLRGVEWLPSTARVLALLALSREIARGSAEDVGQRLVSSSVSSLWLDGPADVAFRASVCCAVLSGASGEAARTASSMEESTGALVGYLSAALLAEHRARLSEEVARRLVEQRARARQRLSEDAVPAADVPVQSVDSVLRNLSTVKYEALPGKAVLGVAFCGHQQSGKSTLCGRLLADLGAVSKRNMEKLASIATPHALFSFITDTLAEERERGISINLSKRACHTNAYDCTFVDVPGIPDFIKSAIRGIAQADVAVIVVPARDASALQKCNRKLGIPMGGSRLHAIIASTLGLQCIFAVTHMDSVAFDETRFLDMRMEIERLAKTFNIKPVVVVPVSGWSGDNVVTPSSSLPWWKGQARPGGGGHIITLVDAIDAVNEPKRLRDDPPAVPLSDVFRIRGVGSVVTGRVECGVVKPGDIVHFQPGGQTATVTSVERHNLGIPQAHPGACAGFALRGLDRHNAPVVGDIMRLQPRGRVAGFVAHVQVLALPNPLAVGKHPEFSCHARTSSGTVQLRESHWMIGKRTGGRKVENSEQLNSNEMHELVFHIKTSHLTVDEELEGLSRLLLFQGNDVVMIGKVKRTFS